MLSKNIDVFLEMQKKLKRNINYFKCDRDSSLDKHWH